MWQVGLEIIWYNPIKSYWLIDWWNVVRPKTPFLELLSKPMEGNIFTVDTVFRARCISGEATPAANISWYLDNTILEKPTNKLERTVVRSVGDLSIFTTKQEISWRLTPDDNNRMLVCTTPHFTDNVNNLPESTSYKLNVHCKCNIFVNMRYHPPQLIK